jgi:hypothetical protein
LGIPACHPRRAPGLDHAAPLSEPPNPRFQRLFEQVPGRGGVHDERTEDFELWVGQQRAQGFAPARVGGTGEAAGYYEAGY